MDSSTKLRCIICNYKLAWIGHPLKWCSVDCRSKDPSYKKRNNPNEGHKQVFSNFSDDGKMIEEFLIEKNPSESEDYEKKFKNLNLE
jgi:hypothetical protein